MASINFFARLGNLWNGFISLWIADVDRRGAIDLAHDALAAYEAAGAARRDAATEVARWVAAHERR